MADDSRNATIRYRGALGTRQFPISGRQITLTATVEAAAAASAATVYVTHRIPTSARIIGGLSKVYFDDLASTGSPTLDIGLKAVNANFTTDNDCLNDGIDVFTAAGSASVIKDIVNYGKQAWEFTSATSDPGGSADVTVTILDAGVNTGGTITVELTFSTDA